jgi:hypothetical protein
MRLSPDDNRGAAVESFTDATCSGTVAIGFFIGAAVMAVGGAAELLFGVHAERTPLENIAKPLTVVDAVRATVTPAASAQANASPPGHRSGPG